MYRVKLTDAGELAYRWYSQPRLERKLQDEKIFRVLWAASGLGFLFKVNPTKAYFDDADAATISKVMNNYIRENDLDDPVGAIKEEDVLMCREMMLISIVANFADNLTGGTWTDDAPPMRCKQCDAKLYVAWRVKGTLRTTYSYTGEEEEEEDDYDLYDPIGVFCTKDDSHKCGWRLNLEDLNPEEIPEPVFVSRLTKPGADVLELLDYMGEERTAMGERIRTLLRTAAMRAHPSGQPGKTSNPSAYDTNLILSAVWHEVYPGSAGSPWELTDVTRALNAKWIEFYNRSDEE